MNIPDYPVISNMERTGTPDGRKPTYPSCPFCGKECETMYKNRHGAYIGCDVCVETKDAWEVDLCFPESEDE